MAEMSSSVSEREKLTKLLKFLEQDSIHFRSEYKKPVVKADKVTDVTILSHPKPPVFDFRTWSKQRTSLAKEFSTYGIKSGFVPGSRSLIGGQPITLETAMELRKIVSGSCMHSLSSDWKKSSLTFHYLESPFPYGLQTQRCGSKGVILCLQAFIIKYLIFTRQHLDTNSLLKTSNYERNVALVHAMSEVLWTAGEGKRCCVCLHQEETCFGINYKYRDDKVTEKLYIFEFKKLEDVTSFLNRYIEQFQKLNSFGCILFVYSLILSRSIPSIRKDMDIDVDSKEKLLNDMEECTTALINLLLTGRAVPKLHNGDILYDTHSVLLSKPLHGIKERSTIGFLYWNKPDEARTEVGSMLKTPKYPIWLTSINNQIGLLFSTILDLISDWRIEHRFQLHYYTGLLNHPKPTILSIDTVVGNSNRPKTAKLLQKEKDKKIPPLDHCIRTKWFGANVNWNGTVPHI